MFRVVEFENGRFGLQNTLTGYLVNKNGKVKTFRTADKAVKYIDKINERLLKALDKLRGV